MAELTPGDLYAGQFRLERKLGEGAFGATWLAEQIDVGRHVALKVGHASVPSLRGMFREARAVARIRHPGIACVLDSGIVGSRLHIAYEWIDGRSVAEVLRDGRLPLSRALEIASAIAETLAAVHAHGMIHRDLKPSNVLIPVDKRRPAVLLDFGVSGQLRVDTGTTRVGEIFGTPHYMSPEQLMGAPQSATADVYGLGALLFEMLYGHPLFAGSSGTMVLSEILTTSVTFPEEPAVPDRVRHFIARCLEKNPNLRPSDGVAARELLIISGQMEAVSGLMSVMTAPMSEPTRRVASSPAPAAGSAVEESESRIRFDFSPSEFLTRPRAPSSLVQMAIVAGVFGAVVLVGALFGSIRSAHAPSGREIRALAGIGIAALGVAAAFWTRRFIRGRKTELVRDAQSLFGRAHTREELSRSIALDLGELIDRCRELDERILGSSIALMVTEYQNATDSDDRQKALMNAVQLLEKLTLRLSPWYVRNEKLVPTVVGLIGLFSGAATTVLSLLWKK